MGWGDISIIVEDSGISTTIQKKLSYLLDDWEVQEGVTKIVRDEMNKFVPRKTGNLTSESNVEVILDEIIWLAPYAHYQYTGFVYGPNFLVTDENGNAKLDENGESMWRTPKGTEKYNTGRFLNYHTPGTGSRWDEALMDDSNARRIMNIRITNYLKRMAREKDL